MDASDATAAARQDDILHAIHAHKIPTCVIDRIRASRDETGPWTSSMAPAELLVARSHGIRPIVTISATSWMHRGTTMVPGGFDGISWCSSHRQGWMNALGRLRDEAKAAGANAVVDVRMRTIPMKEENSMDFSLIGTAVTIDGLAPSDDPAIATVSALQFVRLLNADIVPTGIAVGAASENITSWKGRTNFPIWSGNTEMQTFSDARGRVWQRAHAELRQNGQQQGTGLLAHTNLNGIAVSQDGNKGPNQFLAWHIVIATTIDAQKLQETSPWIGRQFNNRVNVHMVLDLHSGRTPLKRKTHHHPSYNIATGEETI